MTSEETAERDDDFILPEVGQCIVKVLKKIVKTQRRLVRSKNSIDSRKRMSERMMAVE